MERGPKGLSLLKVAIRFEPDIVTARQKSRRIAQALGFDSQDQIRMATAVSELARNVFQYVGRGDIEFFFCEESPQTLFVRVSDEGHGISAVDQILNGTYVSKSGMGRGLLGTKKLMDYFDIATGPTIGTTVTIGKIFDKSMRTHSEATLRAIAESFVSTQAENPFEELRNQNTDLLYALEEVRAAKEELASLNRELEVTNRGVVALYAELDEKAIEADLANHAKSRFLSNMSHEIRTPLGVIQGFADLAMDPTLSQPERHEFLSTIRRNAYNLTRLIGEILDLSKIEAGLMEIESARFSMPTMISEIVTALDLQAKEKGICLSFEFQGNYPESVTSDPTRLRQILINVITNAIKFTDRGSVKIRTKLRSRSDALESAFIEFHVTDTGIGLSSEQQLRLFQAFVQADSSTTRKFGGTGLGLNLSKKLAQALGGDLILTESELGKGSTFQITFNAGTIKESELTDPAKFKNKPESLPPTFSDELGGLRVLLVEDSIDNQKLFTRYLSRAGASVDVASDGIEGVDLARKNEYNVILMDVQMPRLDGYAATSMLRADGNKVPIVALTAHALREDRENALSKGFDHYLTKPLNSRLLIEMLSGFRNQ
jgi:signal transduction histidine kinase/CheY-like chemotaxis protein